MKHLIISLVFAATTLLVSAVEPTEQILKYAVNYQAYPYTNAPAPALSKAPKGYEPFHIEHYGRHGSRWHTGPSMYDRPVEYLTPAHEQGKLTPRGEELYARLLDWQHRSRLREGELTPLGAEQHQGIARRMAANFPEIFRDSTHIDARSTVVIRCILSMQNELMELHAINPRMTIKSDASEADMHYLNHNDTIIRKEYKKALKKLTNFNKEHYNRGDYLRQIINDSVFAADSIDAQQLFFYLNFYLANTQSHDIINPDYDIFTEKELHEQWLINNAQWYLRFGNSPLHGKGPYTQRYLLKNIIESADTALASPRLSANLRFGHEVCVVPLVVLMEIDDYGVVVNDLDSVASKWKNYEIFPMAANVQLIFYRPKHGKKGDILVKALLNEREVRLPATPVEGAYYRWNDLRNYYLNKINTYEQS